MLQRIELRISAFIAPRRTQVDDARCRSHSRRDLFQGRLSLQRAPGIKQVYLDAM